MNKDFKKEPEESQQALPRSKLKIISEPLKYEDTQKFKTFDRMIRKNKTINGPL